MNQFLKEHPNIIVFNTNKGNVTAMMYRENYVNKNQELLNEVKYYKKLRSDPSCTLQQKTNKFVC